VTPALPETAAELGAVADKAFAALGGVDAAREAETRPAHRAAVLDTLDALGIDEIDPRSDPDSLAAAAALCLAAGRAVLPCPVPALLLRDADGRPFAVVPGAQVRVDHGDLFDEWRVASLGGAATSASPGGDPLHTRLGPFVTDLRAGDAMDGDGSGDVALHLTLTSWSVLGACVRAVELAAEHVTSRVQFGKPLSAFQAVQFQLADASVAVTGLGELAAFTLWRLGGDPAGATVDALALRLQALDVARGVLRTCQQLHGAAGVCDEYDVSVLARHVQPALRLPFGSERTADELDAAIGRDGFDGLFPHGAGLDERAPST
jgi:acyl-CoA dehydrogenase